MFFRLCICTSLLTLFKSLLANHRKFGRFKSRIASKVLKRLTDIFLYILFAYDFIMLVVCIFPQ